MCRASGADYSLIGAHIADMIENWSEVCFDFDVMSASNRAQ